MKVSVFAAAALIGTVSAYHPSFVGRNPNVKLASTTAEPVVKGPPPLTRFERIKKTWKGGKATIPATDLDFSYDDFATAVAETSYEFDKYSTVTGVCVEYDQKGVIVDIGAKATAYMKITESALIQDPGQSIEDLVALDVPMEFQIISEEDENGQLQVSIRRLEYNKAWTKILEKQDSDEVFMAPIIAINRGGAICLVDGLRAFLPGSHVAGAMLSDEMMGTVLPLKFLEVSRENNKLIVSNRKAVVQQQMTDLSRGDIIEGSIKAIKPYGAFVDVGGMSGLLHISQISYDRIENLESILQAGMVIKCMIIDHDKVNGRIALSTKTLEAEPGDMLKNPAMVFANAEETARKYHERMESERKAREEAARDIVMGLGDSLDDLGAMIGGGDEGADLLADVSDSLDSLLA